METLAEIRRGDVVLLPFPYVTDFRKAKTRPALVIQNDVGNRFGSTVIVALISSSVPAKRYPMQYAIPHPSPVAKAAGLSAALAKYNLTLTAPALATPTGTKSSKR